MTESTHAQETLRESEQLARGIIKTSLDAFVQMDETRRDPRTGTRRPRTCSAGRARRRSGKNAIRSDRREPDRAGPPGSAEQFLRSGRSNIRRSTPRRAVQRDATDTEFTAELSITALGRRNGFVFNGFVRDLTDKIAAEERIRQSEKMEAIGQLTGGIAHDFNNILTVITGTIEILADAVAREPQLAAITRMIDEAAARGADLTQHLLAFARRQPLQPRETDINLAARRYRQAAAADARRAHRDRIGAQG